MGSALGRNSNPIRDEDQPQSRSPNAAMVAPKSRASSCGAMAEFPTGNLAKAQAFYSKKHPG